MPVIAFNASAKVAEWYNDIQKGKRSKILNGRLEQALRLENETNSNGKSHYQLELEIQQLKDSIQRFQARLFVEENKELVRQSKIKKLLKWITRRNKRAIID